MLQWQLDRFRQCAFYTELFFLKKKKGQHAQFVFKAKKKSLFCKSKCNSQNNKAMYKLHIYSMQEFQYKQSSGRAV